jgi:6-phosphogluconolactonase
MSIVERERPPTVRERRFEHPAALVETLAGEIHQLLDNALQARGGASLVVSGGTSPIPLFRSLRQLDLDWSRVFITLADERWVAVDDPASNEGMVRRELLQDRAAAARFTGLKTTAPTPQLGAAESWARLGSHPRPFDVLILGMGDDGHTASLFPGSPGITQALDPDAAPACVAMSAPVAPNARISLNLAALAQSRRVVLHITGEKKWGVYRDAARAAARDGDSPPVAAILRQRLLAPQVCWSP